MLDASLRSLPNVGPATERDLRAIGIDRPSCLKGKNPESLYRALERVQGSHVDRCMLYVFRALVAYVEGGKRDPEHFVWWNFSDRATGKNTTHSCAARPSH